MHPVTFESSEDKNDCGTVSLPVNPRLAHELDFGPEIGCEISLERGGFGFCGAIDRFSAWVFAVPDVGVCVPV